MTDPAHDAVRRALPDRVADRIRAKILKGTLKPGDRLPSERELAEELRVNRGSVREALKKLEQLRLISIQQGSGIRVCKLEEASFDLVREIILEDGGLNTSWLGDLLELREALLPGVLRLALERATAAECAETARRLRRAAAPELSAEEFGQELRALQNEFARMSRNRVVLMLSHSLGRFMPGEAPRALIATLRDRDRFLAPLQLLAVAVEARDVETADRALRDLLRRHTRATLESVDGGAPDR